MTDPLAPAGLAVRWMLLTGILLAVGSAGFRFAVLARFGRGSGNAPLEADLGRRAALVGLVGAVLALSGAVMRLPLQLREISDPAAAAHAQLHALLTATMWGKAWHAQVGAALLAAVGFALARRGRRLGWPLAALAVAVLAFTPALAGHAIGSERLTALAVAADGLHVVAAGCWIGAMVALLAGLGLPRSAGRPELAGLLVAAFSPLALGAAATVAASGLLSAWLHVVSLEALVDSRYGRTVLIKGGTVLAVMITGAYNWRRAGPRLILDGDESAMRRSIRAELALAALVLLATAVLVVTPPPGEE